MTIPTSRNVLASVMLGFGDGSNGTDQYAVNYQSSNGYPLDVANRLIRRSYSLPPSQLDFAVVITVQSLIWLAVVDLGDTGVNVGLVSGSPLTKWGVGKGKPLLASPYVTAGSITLYLDNPSSVYSSFGEIVVLGLDSAEVVTPS